MKTLGQTLLPLSVLFASAAVAANITDTTITASRPENMYIANNSTYGYSAESDTIDFANCDLLINPSDGWLTLRMPDEAGTFTVRSFTLAKGEGSLMEGYLEAFAPGADLEVLNDMNLNGKFETNNTRFYTAFKIGGNLNMDLSHIDISIDDNINKSLVAFGKCDGANQYGGLSGLHVGGDINAKGVRNFFTLVSSTSADNPSFNVAGSVNLEDSHWNLSTQGYDQRTYVSLGGLNGNSNSMVAFWGTAGNPYYTLNFTNTKEAGVKEFSGQIATDAGNYESAVFNMKGGGTQIIRAQWDNTWYGTINAENGRFLLGSNADNHHVIVNVSGGLFGAVSLNSPGEGGADTGTTFVDQLNWTSGAGGIIVNIGYSVSEISILESATLDGDSFNFYFEGDASHINPSDTLAIISWADGNADVAAVWESAVAEGMLHAYLNGSLLSKASFGVEGNYLYVTGIEAVPEASEFAAILGVAALLFSLRRRRK